MDQQTCVTVVHVGKTSGSSVITELRRAQVPNTDEVHMRSFTANLFPKCKHSTLVISIRDPIDRLVSAYNWIRPPHSSGYHVVVTEAHKQFYACFPSLDSLLWTNLTSPACSKLRHELFFSKTRDIRSNMTHFLMGHEFYLHRAFNIGSPPRYPFLTVDPATYERDMSCVFATLGRARPAREARERVQYGRYDRLNASGRAELATWPFIRRESLWYNWTRAHARTCATPVVTA